MTTVVGMFETTQEVDKAVNTLTRRGFGKGQLGVVARREVLKDTGIGVGVTTEVGAITGATAGGIAGLLLGLGVIAVPGIGPLVAAGEFLTWVGAALLGAAAGALGGGLIGALVGFGMPEHIAQRYVEGVKQGKILLTIQTTPDRTQEAIDTLREANAVEVDVGGYEAPGLEATAAQTLPPVYPQ